MSLLIKLNIDIDNQDIYKKSLILQSSYFSQLNICKNFS